ncbi:MAG: 3-keto-disaccharide hydrolase [Pseudoclavibacter sp.]
MTKPAESEFTPLFNGENLDGWFSIPRVYSTLWEGGPTIEEAFAHLPEEQRFNPDFLARTPDHEASWTVEDGAITGRQHPNGEGFGGFLLTEKAYADFELRLEANPDWPADTGILVRKTADSWKGIQILLDHRRSGSIGGYYGNGIGSFHAVAFNLDAELDAAGNLVRLKEEDPETTIEPIGDKTSLLTRSATGAEFLEAWRVGDWNEFRIRVEGRLPRITTWINDVLISEIDLGTLEFENYDAEATAATLGRAGHIALEVHDTDPMMGPDRWGPESACRWRNIRVLELPTS